MSDARTVRANVASDIENYVTPKVMAWMENQLCGDIAAAKGDRIPTKKGDTIEFCRVLQQAKDTTELTAGVQPDSVSLFTMDVTAQAKEFGARINIDRVPALTAKHLDLLDKGSKVLGMKLADSCDYLIMKMIGENAYRVRADYDSTYQVDITTTSDGSTTTFISTSLTQSDDHWNGGRSTITGIDTASAAREAIYQTRKVSDFVASTDTVTVSAAYGAAIVTGCTVHLCVATGLLSTDNLSTDIYARSVSRLALNKAARFAGQPGQNMPPKVKSGGYFIVYMSPYTNYGFITDTTWVNMGINQVSENLVNGVGVKWMGCKHYGTTQPYRESAAGAEAETSGAVHFVHFLGQDSYGISDVAAPGAKPPYGTVITFLDAKGLGQTVPRYDELGGIVYFARTPLNDKWNLAVECGAPVL